MFFEEVLPLLRNGARAQRQGWNGTGLWVELQKPDSNSKMTLPYFYLTYPPKGDGTPETRVPWTPSITDILSGDWEASTMPGIGST